MPKSFRPRCTVAIQALVEDFNPTLGEVVEEPFPYIVIPKTVTVIRNTHRQADTVTLELDYGDAPFDPRTLKDARIEVYMGDQDDPGLVALPQDDARYLIFRGHLDEPETTLDANGSKVSWKGRDFTALFLDKKWTTAASIATNRPLSGIVDDMIAATPGADGLIIAYSLGADTVDLSKRMGRTKYKPKAGDDHWTILVELCGFAGLVPIIELSALRIVTASEAVATDQAGTTARFLYGQNVAKLTYTRKLITARNQQVRVTCWDEQNRTTRSATFPADPVIKKTKVSMKGKVTTDKEPIVPYFISGAYTQAEVLEFAQRIYDEAARNEVEGSLETRDLTDLDDETDLWQLKNGDALMVILGTTLQTTLADMSETEAVAWLTAPQRGFAPEAATALVRSWWQAGDACSTFVVKTATHTWSRDDGYKLELTFVNYAVQTG